MTIQHHTIPCNGVQVDEGYAFAGVEYGSECFCGNKPPPEDTFVDQNECDWTCPGIRDLICGALWRMNVYETGESQQNHASLFRCKNNPSKLCETHIFIPEN